MKYNTPLSDDTLTLPPLTQEELQRLDAWLSNLKPALNLFYVHGFLTALNTCPCNIPPTEWFPAMLVPDLPDVVPEEEMQVYLDRVMQLKLELADSLSHDEQVFPLIDFRPIPRLDAQSLFPDQRPRLKAWAEGYLSAITLRPKKWQALRDFQNLTLILKIIANEDQTAHLLGIANQGVSPGQIQTLAGQMMNSLPVILGMAYDQACDIDDTKPNHKLKKTDINILSSVERNKRQAPCPCGSNKPFAECCALSRETQH